MADWAYENCRDPEKLRSFLANVKGKRPDLYEGAFRHLCTLEAMHTDDPVVAEFWRAVAALDQIYFEKCGRRKGASGIRRQERQSGAVATLDSLAAKKRPTNGFMHLVENGLIDLTAEYIVLRWPERFSEKAVATAHKRLSDYAPSMLPADQTA